MRSLGLFVRLLAIAGSAMATPAFAGPPYVTDDPETPEPDEIEMITFVEGDRFPGQLEGGAGFDVNYGLARDLQLSTVVSVGFEHGVEDEVGINDLEVGLKYRFLHQTESGGGLDLAFYPSVTLPTGSDAFRAEKASVFLPLWGQKDMGAWSVFGGGGYTINPGAGNKNFWSVAAAATREVAPRLSLGGEVFYEAKSEVGGSSTVGAGVGGEYEINDRLSLVGSAGPYLTNTDAAGDFRFFIGVVLVR